MKKLISENFFKVLLIVAFICLAFYQWKNEKVYSVESDSPIFENVSSIADQSAAEVDLSKEESN